MTTYQQDEPEGTDETVEHEPDEDSLPEKPPVGDLPSDEDLEIQPEAGEEEVPESDFMAPEDAQAADDVDNEENDEN